MRGKRGGGESEAGRVGRGPLRAVWLGASTSGMSRRYSASPAMPWRLPRIAILGGARAGGGRGRRREAGRHAPYEEGREAG